MLISGSLYGDNVSWLRRRRDASAEDPAVELGIDDGIGKEAFARHWAVAMECLRPYLGVAVVAIIPNPRYDFAMRPSATAEQCDAADALASIALELASVSPRRSARRSDPFFGLEIDLEDNELFELIQHYGPCSINVDIHRRDTSGHVLNTHDEGSTMTVTLASADEQAAFLTCIESKGLDPTDYYGS